MRESRQYIWGDPTSITQTKQNKKKHKEIHKYITHIEAQLLGSFWSVNTDSQAVDLTLVQLADLPWD